MLNAPAFLKLIRSHNIQFSTGVPDSLLKDLCACLADDGKDIIAANEGGAIALATGHHLATKEIPLVYMQNSGFGNSINPLTSLVDPEVYSIPMLLLVGWRGEPGTKDEPQHLKQGHISEALLQALDIPYAVLSSSMDEVTLQLDAALKYMHIKSAPYVFLVRKHTFAPYKIKHPVPTPAYEMSREMAIQLILDQLGPDDVVVSTTGMTSREVFEKRASDQNGHDRDFLTVGCMGHASQIALGIALAKPKQRVFCLDGDGAFLMHMGAAAIIGNLAHSNFYHIVINNGSHDSVGGQPTVGFHMEFTRVAEACGYQKTFLVNTRAGLTHVWNTFIQTPGPVFLEIHTRKGARKNLGRPTIAPVKNKHNFMNKLNQHD